MQTPYFLMSGLQGGKPFSHENPFFCGAQSGTLCPSQPVLESLTDALPQPNGHLTLRRSQPGALA